METAEDEFVVAVDESMSKMKMVAEGQESIKAVIDLIGAQLNYFKEAHDTLAELHAALLKIQSE